MLAVSGPVAESIGNVVGLSDVAVAAWNVVKWPIILVFIAVSVAILYYVAPNVKQPRFRWLSIGAGVAIVVWILASVLFGAELDAELERGRQLQVGLPAERELQLPPKDARGLKKDEAAEKKDLERARRLRHSRGRRA
jgi:membrane protein